MKTPEEIEKLAKKLCNIKEDLIIDEEERYYKNFQKYDGVIIGYTQCQQDNAERKYTKQEMIDFAFDTYCFISGIMKVPFNQISENKYHAENNFETYLTTLNKQ